MYFFILKNKQFGLRYLFVIFFIENKLKIRSICLFEKTGYER